MKRVLLAMASLGALAVLVAMAPDVRRYIRMVSM
jgi:hypothetical protein